MAALYRKYRPQAFGEVIGQEHVVKTLQNSLASGSVSHAYLFCGPRGSGKTTIARLFAKALNCADRKGSEPCNKCPSCVGISEGRAIDLLEIDAASHRGIDEIRELRDGLKFAPVSSKYKIFIIDECHQLSKDAANALLKTLEEPPSHVIFIFATTEAHKMIATIVSRCQRFDFKKLQTPEIIEKLKFIAKKEKVSVEDAAFSVIALNARGSFRDAESLLDKCFNFAQGKNTLSLDQVKELLGIVEISQIAAFLDLVLGKNAKDAVVMLNTLLSDSVDLQEFAKTLVYYVHQALLLKLNPDSVTIQNSGMSAEELQKIKSQINPLSIQQVQAMVEAFLEAETNMKYANIQQLPLELAVLDLAQV